MDTYWTQIGTLTKVKLIKQEKLDKKRIIETLRLWETWRMEGQFASLCLPLYWIKASEGGR